MLESTENMVLWTNRIVQECQFDYPINKYLQGKKNTCVDAGANVGGFIINYHYMFENIYAYEPSTININQCRANLEERDIKNANLFHAAVGKTEGDTVKLKKHNNTENCGSFGTVDFKYENGHGWTDEGGTEEVSTVSLESIISEVGNVDVLKVDIEGAEHDFLFQKDLTKVDFIFMEIHNFLIDLGVQSELVDWISRTHMLLTPYDPNFKDYHQHLVFRRK
tara:strand:+ start:2948 stop:3613 length:666 start_codon:yes stop_codon:yes gene_type:complete